MVKKFSACEIIEIAIQIEKNGRDFYNKLAGITESIPAEKVLRDLAGAEEDHIKVFSDIFSGACSHDPEGAYPDEYYLYINSLASGFVFNAENGGLEAGLTVKSYEEGLDIGISIEKDSILFYEEMKKFVDASEHQKLDKLIGNEKEHLNRLVCLKEEGKNEKCKDL